MAPFLAVPMLVGGGRGRGISVWRARLRVVGINSIAVFISHRGSRRSVRDLCVMCVARCICRFHVLVVFCGDIAWEKVAAGDFMSSGERGSTAPEGMSTQGMILW